MKIIHSFQTILAAMIIVCSASSFAWDHSIDFGYGYSHDWNNVKYNNSGFLLSADFYPLWRTPRTFWLLNGAIGQWHSTAPIHQNLTTLALDVAVRFYPFLFEDGYPAYLLGSVGPAYMSSRQFGTNTQGSNLSFQINVGLGVEIKNIDLNLRFVHYSNAHLANPDQGFTIIYMLSLGYLF